MGGHQIFRKMFLRIHKGACYATAYDHWFCIAIVTIASYITIEAWHTYLLIRTNKEINFVSGTGRSRGAVRAMDLSQGPGLCSRETHSAPQRLRALLEETE